MDLFSINRRKFIQRASATLAVSAFGERGLDLLYPVKTWRVALIGTGWYGKSDLFRLIQVSAVNVVALCDTDKQQLEHAAKMVASRQQSGKVPRLYSDYRKMLAENQLDIVLIGTPDHWHALTCIAALRAGAHVYVQKPVSADVMEGEAMLAAARKYNRVVQVGMQRRSTPHFIEAKKNIVQAGLLGKVSHVEICCYFHMRNTSYPAVQPVPAYFDYQTWTGPAPLRPYDGIPHIGWWRAFMSYGNGIMGDMGVHMLDAVRWMLDLGWPKRISSTGGIYVQKSAKSDITDTQTALFEFDELNCIWQHRTWGTAADAAYPWSLKLYGEKGTLEASTMGYDFIPEGKGLRIHGNVEYEQGKYPEDQHEPGIELNAASATRRHMLDFLSAIEDGRKPVSDIEQGHISTASCILANISMKTGSQLIYNADQKMVIGNKEATLLLQRPYRDPYIHPDYRNL